MELWRLLRREPRARLRALAVLTVLSALATVIVIASVSAAAGLAARGVVSLRLAGLFVVATALYALVQNALMSGFAAEVEALIHRLRRELFDAIRRADPERLGAAGRGPLFAAITQDTQTISRNLPLLVIGAQQLVLVLCISVYLATLSPVASGLALLFSGVAVAVHLRRMRVLGAATARAESGEGRLFEGLRGLLQGHKELRLSAARSAALAAELGAVSAEARQAKSAIKAAWGREFALIQLAFYVLVGLMVFVVPLLTDDFHAVALPGTMAALFLIGPVGTVATAIPVVGDAERSLAAIRTAGERLRAPDDARDEAAPPLPGPIRRFALRDLRYTYPPAGGEPGFSVGPLSASFAAGQITFITGGNGSGKSTLVRLLTGLQAAQGGTIEVDGVALAAARLPAWRDQIAAVFADFHLFARLYGVEPAAWARAEAWLARLELTDKVALRDGAFSTTDLSTGQRKRLALIAALLEDKPVLVLDEWAADQDPHFRRVFYEELLPELRAEGRIVICVTHDDRWFGLADQVLHLEEGRLLPPTPEDHPAG